MSNPPTKDEPSETTADASPSFKEDIESVLRPSTRLLLTEYSRIPDDEIVEHIRATRLKAWEVAPYASVGALTWLNSYMTLHFSWDDLFAAVKGGKTILDCGCMVAPDLRYLAWKGCPTENMYAFDIEPRFWPISYEFYRDESTFEGKFMTADVLADYSTTELAPLLGKVDVLWVPKLLHLFDREKQVETASKMLKLLRPVPGSMFCGSQNGFPESYDITIKHAGFDVKSYQANAEDYEKVWNEVAERTGTKWDFKVTLLDMRTIGLHKEDGTDYSKRTGYNLQWTAVLKEINKDSELLKA